MERTFGDSSLLVSLTLWDTPVLFTPPLPSPNNFCVKTGGKLFSKIHPHPVLGGRNLTPQSFTGVLVFRVSDFEKDGTLISPVRLSFRFQQALSSCRSKKARVPTNCKTPRSGSAQSMRINEHVAELLIQSSQLVLQRLQQDGPKIPTLGGSHDRVFSKRVVLVPSRCLGSDFLFPLQHPTPPIPTNPPGCPTREGLISVHFGSVWFRPGPFGSVWLKTIRLCLGMRGFCKGKEYH